MPKHARLTRPTDLRAPGAIEALLAFHRQTFGDTRMADDPPADPPADPAPADPPPADPPKDPAPTPPADKPGKVEDLPEWAQKLIKDTRSEAAGNRTKATEAETKNQQTLDAIATALGFKKGDDAPTAEQLATRLSESESKGRAATVELAVFKAASAAGADPLALTDSRTFMTKVSDLDPSAKDFDAKVKAEIETAVKNNPKLKVAPAAGRSAADHAGGTGEASDPASKAQPGQARLAAAYASGS